MRESVEKMRSYCSTEVAMSILGGKWKAVIVKYLLDSPHRHGELMTKLHGVTQRTLTKQLRELEEDGLVSRHEYPEMPPRVEYSVTELGATLDGIVVQLTEWGKHYRDRHALSGPQDTKVK